jgi:hypothetical protein
LYDQSFKLLRSSKKVAEKYEKVTTLIEIRYWEKRLLEKDNYDNVKDEDLAAILKEDQDLVEKLKTYDKLWNLKSQIFKTLYVKGKIRSEEELTKFKAILDKANHAEEAGLNHPANMYLLNHLSSAYYFGLGDYETCYPFLANNIELIQSKRHIFDEEPNVYMSVLTNAIHVATRLGKAEEAYKYIDYLGDASNAENETTNEDREMRMFSISRSAELNLFIQQGEFAKGISMVPEIEEGLVKYEEKLSSVKKASLYFNIAIAFFGHGDHNESLKWTNQLLNNIDIDQTQDIHCMGQILNLIIHLELGNKSLLPYTLRSTQRYLETRNKVYQFERHAFDFYDFLAWAEKHAKVAE